MENHPSAPLRGAKSVPRTLTELAIRAAELPASGTLTLWDGSLKNFGCRISAKGTKSFIVLVASGSRQTIGRFPTLSLAEARAAAKRALAEKTLGKVRPNTIGYLAAVEEFLVHSEAKNRPRTVLEYKRLLTAHFPFGTTRLADITSEQIEKRLKLLGDRPSERQHAFTSIKVFFNWALKRRYVQSNPCGALFAPAKTESRSRVLSDSELRTVLKNARTQGGAYGKIVELLILTGQRRGEIAALQWDWIDEKERIITLPALTRQKQPRARVPLRPHGRQRSEDNSAHQRVPIPCRQTPPQGSARHHHCRVERAEGRARQALQDRALDAARPPPHIRNEPRRARHADSRHRETTQPHLRHCLRRRRDLQPPRLHGRDARSDRRLGKALVLYPHPAQRRRFQQPTSPLNAT